ncbi:globin domain-containing protein [Actinocorallia populi]|uniref:globin domain-containing protein n=1 Tax=Actinocorallia populi TaxID=2079200 RepID=UPI000D088A11|nr:globin domain-containing protein [Actinocorallia populi]
MSLDTGLLKETFALLTPHLEDTAAYFYGRLFAARPGIRAFFPPAMDAQRERLFRTITEIIDDLDEPELLRLRLDGLGRDHRKFGVTDEHYTAVGEALLAALGRFLGPHWTPEVRREWEAFYGFAAGIMREAARADAERGPSWWIGEVVGHERRGADLAVLTVRPDQPLPFRAGQYLTVQSARWPRVWRPYSVANAPREDGLLGFHVRALPGGWVSGALVRRTGTGDTLLLGPALGAMTLDPGSARDVLCVAGGTGLAPLKAITEQALAENGARRVVLVFGARSAEGLYDLPALRLLEAAHPRLKVVAAVSDDPRHRGLQGTAPEAVGGLRDWSEHDVYVAGPHPMIAATLARLRRLGVPAERVRHDPLSGMAARTGVPLPASPSTPPASDYLQ